MRQRTGCVTGSCFRAPPRSGSPLRCARNDERKWGRLERRGSRGSQRGVQVELLPHPTTKTSPVERINVVMDAEPEPLLTYRVYGDLDKVRLSSLTALDPANAGRRDELWRTTCFECFYGPADGDEYIECNFALTLDWAVYRFDGYRRGMRPSSLSVLGMTARLAPDHVELCVFPPLERFARPDLSAPKLRLGLSAVIEAIDGSFSYWALAHPSDRPDFHHPDSFVLELP